MGHGLEALEDEILIVGFFAVFFFQCVEEEFDQVAPFKEEIVFFNGLHVIFIFLPPCGQPGGFDGPSSHHDSAASGLFKDVFDVLQGLDVSIADDGEGAVLNRFFDKVPIRPTSVELGGGSGMNGDRIDPFALEYFEAFQERGFIPEAQADFDGENALKVFAYSANNALQRTGFGEEPGPAPVTVDTLGGATQIEIQAGEFESVDQCHGFSSRCGLGGEDLQQCSLFESAIPVNAGIEVFQNFFAGVGGIARYAQEVSGIKIPLREDLIEGKAIGTIGDSLHGGVKEASSGNDTV